MDLQLDGKRAIVTGGSRGIGKAVARQLAREGCAVALVARDQQRLTDTAAELHDEAGGRVIGISADTGEDEPVRRMVEEVVEAFDGIDILVNGAAAAGGARPAKQLADITAEALFEDFNIKVLGYVRCAQAVAPHLRAQGWGRIINIGGLAARTSGVPVTGMRNVSVATLTKNLADELGPDGINVTVVHPSITWTEKTPGIIASRAAAEGRSEAEVQAAMGSGTAVGRIITAEEVADVVTFLASPRSVAINGDAVAAGGGVRGPIYY